MTTRAMAISFQRVLGDAWALWRRDRDLLVRIAAPFVLLPSMALRLLVPQPDAPEGAALAQVLELEGRFAAAHAAPLLLAAAATQLGCAALYAFYCHPEAGDVRTTLARAARLWPRLVLLAIMVQLGTLAGSVLFVLPGLILLGRALPGAPLLFARQPLGAAAAFGRAVRLTAGHTAIGTALAATVLGWQVVADLPFARMDAWLRGLNAPNPVALAVIDFGGAAADMLATIAGVLVAVSFYRALAAGAAGASRGT